MAVTGPREHIVGSRAGISRIAASTACCYLLVLALRRDLFFIFYAPTALTVAGTMAVQIAVARWARRLTHRLYRWGWPARRLMWLLPLGSYVLWLAALLAVLFGPRATGTQDFWPRALDLPARVVSRLAVDHSIFLAVSTLLLLISLVSDRLRDGACPDLGATAAGIRDIPTSLTLILTLLLLLAILLNWQFVMPDNLLFTRALLSLSVSERPRKALAHFNALLERFPESNLRDTAIFRAARIHEEELDDPQCASALFERLIREHPGSPWCDDAAFHLAVLAERLHGSGAAETALAEFARRYPESCLADDALVRLVELHVRRGRPAEAERVLGILVRTRPNGRIFSDDPADYPFSIRSSAAAAGEAIRTLPSPR